MANVSSLGIGSGIDLASMLTKLMAAEQQPLTKLQTKLSTTNSTISTFGTLKDKLATLKAAADKLQSPLSLNAMGATTGDSKILSASAAFNASTGSYSVTVDTLASSQKSFSNAFNNTTPALTFTQGTLDFKFGTTTKTVTLDQKSSYTLNDIRGAINDAGIGVTATLVSGQDGDRLIFTGSQTGAAGAFTLSATNGTGDTGSLDLSDVAAFDTTTPDLKTSAAADAKFYIDGIVSTSSSNTITDKISGVTLNLVAKGTSTLNVALDSTAVTSALQSFVDAYNAVGAFIKSNSAYNSTTKVAQAFNGDSTIRSLQGLLSRTRSSIPSDLTGATYQTLTSLGVSIDDKGTMSLNTSTLNTALGKSTADVTKTLNAYGTAFYNALNSALDSKGLVENRVNGLNSLVKTYNSNITSLQTRLDRIEKQYRAQFTALDRVMTQLQSTSSYMSQQLAQYNKSSA